jgi:hypothetical protein
MKSIASMKPYLAWVGLAAVVLTGGCAMMEPKAERYVAPPLGSTWTTAQRNTGSFGSSDVQVQTTRGEQTWQGKQVVTFASSQATILANPDDGKWIAFLGPDGKPVVSFDPPTGFNWPLSVGKTWTNNIRLTMHAANRTIPYAAPCTVESYGDVTVPAGTFKAFKIACTTTLPTEETYWYSPEMGLIVKSSLKRAGGDGWPTRSSGPWLRPGTAGRRQPRVRAPR